MSGQRKALVAATSELIRAGHGITIHSEGTAGEVLLHGQDSAASVGKRLHEKGLHVQAVRGGARLRFSFAPSAPAATEHAPSVLRGAAPRPAKAAPVRPPSAAEDDGSEVVALACRMGLKGFVAPAGDTAKSAPSKVAGDDDDGASEVVALARAMGLKGFADPADDAAKKTS